MDALLERWVEKAFGRIWRRRDGEEGPCCEGIQGQRKRSEGKTGKGQGREGKGVLAMGS